MLGIVFGTVGRAGMIKLWYVGTEDVYLVVTYETFLSFNYFTF
jgi:hypothetical protein